MQTPIRRFRRASACVAAGAILSLCVAIPLASQTGVFSRGDAIEAQKHIDSGALTTSDIDIVRETRTVTAIPGLRKIFAKSDAPSLLNDTLVTSLVRLGDADFRYWQYLQKREESISSVQAPSLSRYDSDGKHAGVNSEFLAWAKSKNMTYDEAYEKHMQDYGFLMLLGETRDQRSVPLLRRQLASRDYDFTLLAAMGLAKLHDEASVPQILAVCRSAPAELRVALAIASLGQFKSEEAQNAARQMLPPDVAAEIGKTFIYEDY